MLENEIKIIKNIIYNDKGGKMNYIDICNEENRQFIDAVEKLMQEHINQNKGERIMKLKGEEIEALAVLDTKLELYGEGEPDFTYKQLDNLSKLIERLLDENEKLTKEV